jgi:desulfoferrodoxin (superoxide reductase-like protein)
MVYAHPPITIQLSYDEYSKAIKIKASHPVSNPRSHYIKVIKVKIDGDLVLEHTLRMQDTDASQFVQYTLPDVKPGDQVRVEAYCSSFGRKMKEIEIK